MTSKTGTNSIGERYIPLLSQLASVSTQLKISVNLKVAEVACDYAGWDMEVLQHEVDELVLK